MADTGIAPLPGCTRLVLRAAPETAARLSGGFGVALPPPLLGSAEGGGRTALRLGPDEMLLLAEAGAAAALLERLAATDCGGPASVVDVSHGHAALRIAGPDAAGLLNAGCPLDLDAAAFPPGACTRTVFGKAEIVLWRRDAHDFRLEVARSFAPYVQALLDEAVAGLA